VQLPERHAMTPRITTTWSPGDPPPVLALALAGSALSDDRLAPLIRRSAGTALLKEVGTGHANGTEECRMITRRARDAGRGQREHDLGVQKVKFGCESDTPLTWGCGTNAAERRR